MKTIVLTGMMGSGKSTIGKQLSDSLGLNFIDLDILIEKSEGKKISQIFETSGETYFRKIEKDLLLQNFSSENFVISLGGGTFENQETQNFLLKKSTVIYLETHAGTILDRIKNDNSRPLLANNMTKDNIQEILLKREANYKKAHLIIKTDNKSVNYIINEILGAIKSD